MKRILMTMAAGLFATAAYAADGVPTQVDANINYTVAVKASARLEVCVGKFRPGDLITMRNFALQDAADISGRDIREILVEVRGEADSAIEQVVSTGSFSDFCDHGGHIEGYAALHLPTKASDETKATIAILDRLVDERKAAEVALDLCDLGENDTARTKAFINDARSWSYEKSGICWDGRCHFPDKELRKALKAISDKATVCKAHADFLAGLKDHPIYAEELPQ
jgi:hypothetical protein